MCYYITELYFPLKMCSKTCKLVILGHLLDKATCCIDFCVVFDCFCVLFAKRLTMRCSVCVKITIVVYFYSGEDVRKKLNFLKLHNYTACRVLHCLLNDEKYSFWEGLPVLCENTLKQAAQCKPLKRPHEQFCITEPSKQKNIVY